MARQLNLLATGQIIPTALHQEMERSYLEYAMSVIVGRALPDVRDGLKPVHRRILYAMHELGLTPDRPFRKCARVVGDVLGKYHPHGDKSVYDALVRMAQDFSTRYPLLAGHGNFGSVDDDPPAAMRYTETRLASIADEAMLSNIGEATVDFTGNFDNSQQEPTILPVQLPILLLNGCTGIAVGMATNVPPHNLAEIVDGLIALIDNPSLTEENLWQLIPGPDFPTGGEIIDTSGIIEAYRTGKGIIPIRGVANVENITLGKKRKREGTAIIITELPYQVNKAAWIEKVADLVNAGRFEGISDLRDESDREGIRVVIELKKDTNPQTILNKLYEQTALQTNFGVIFLALVNNKPMQLSLRQLLEEFLKFREETLTRQYQYELLQAQQRLDLLTGLLTALNNLDTTIEILRNAADGTTAKLRLTQELSLSDSQGDAILAMPMRRLTGLEREKIQNEVNQLQERIAELEKLLSDRHELMKSLKKELRALKRKFGDARRTKIIPRVSVETESKKTGQKKESEQLELEVEVNTPSTLPENAVVEISHNGYIFWKTSSTSLPKNLAAGEDFIVTSETVNAQQQLIVITDTGKAYPISWEDIPHENNKKKKTLINLLPKGAQQETKNIVASFFLTEEKQNIDLILLTQKGTIKRIALEQLNHISNRGLVLIKLKPEESLLYANLSQEEAQIAIATNSSRILLFPIDDQQIPIMGRSAIGNSALRLRYGEEIVGCVCVQAKDSLVLVTDLGYIKRLPVNALRLANRGDIGTSTLQFTHKNDNLATLIKASSNSSLVLTTSAENRLIIPLDSLPLSNKDGVGQSFSRLKTGEKIISCLIKKRSK